MGRLFYILPFLAIGITLFVIFGKFFGPNSRFTARFTEGTIEIPLPEDFAEPISFSSNRSEKNLFYRTASGEMKVKTYTDTGLFEPTIHFVSTDSTYKGDSPSNE